MKSTPRFPEIGEYVRGMGRLLRIESVEPPPPPVPDKDYIFEEITAEKQMRLNGEVLKTYGTLWDFYGCEKSVETAIEEAKAMAKDKKIGPTNDIEIVVIKRVHQQRKQPDGKPSNYDGAFLNLEPKQYGCCMGLPEDVSTIVWSSKNQ